MATYYVRTTGNNGNNGTTPATAWQTLGYALGSTSGFASGDVLYVGAGSYRELVTITMQTPTAETKIIGDFDGSKTGDAGEIIWTAYTTNDTTAPATTSAVIIMNGKDFLTFENITFIGADSSTAQCINAVAAHARNITLRNCTFLPGRTNTGPLIIHTSTFGEAANWLIERCRFYHTNSSSQGTIYFTLNTSASGANYNSNIIIQNCFFFLSGSYGVRADGNTANTFKGGGVIVRNNTCFGNFFQVGNSAVDSTGEFPCLAYNNLIMTGGTAFNANVAGQIATDYNRVWAVTPYTNVTGGANDVSGNTYAPLVDIGQSFTLESMGRPFGTPLSAPLLGFGSSGSVALDSDYLNRPRPAGGQILKAVGALEKHDTAVKETTTVQGGSVAIAITGMGDHDLLIPVDAASTTISIYARYDTNHGTTNKPQVALLANSELGMSLSVTPEEAAMGYKEVKTMTSAANTWEQLTFTAFTPTQSGVVVLRVMSRSAATTGKAFFDTIA
jgi:hypothetical protein